MRSYSPGALPLMNFSCICHTGNAVMGVPVIYAQFTGGGLSVALACESAKKDSPRAIDAPSSFQLLVATAGGAGRAGGPKDVHFNRLNRIALRECILRSRFLVRFLAPAAGAALRWRVV